MAENKITIDPEFLPPPREGRGPGKAVMTVSAVALAAMAFGWLLASPHAGEPETASAFDTDVAEAVTTTTTTTSVIPSPSPLADAGIPLAQLVPGFTDTVVMLTTPPGSFDIVRWDASKPASEVSLSIERDAAGPGSWPTGLDASGSWFARVLGDGILVAYPVPDAGEEAQERQPIGLRVRSAVWHETEPGQLAWLSCSRSSPGPAVPTILDLDERNAEPLQLRPFDLGCVTGRRGGVWLDSWTDRGVAVNAFGPRPTEPTTYIAGVSTLTRTPHRRFEYSIPGHADEQQVVNAARSSDGRLVAANVRPDPDDLESVVRVIDTSSGAVVFEAAGQNSGVVPMAWSTDDRYLLYTRIHSSVEHPGSGLLVIYDTVADRATTVRLGDFVDEIRTSKGPDPA
jgi:hypothetical protein